MRQPLLACISAMLAAAIVCSAGDHARVGALPVQQIPIVAPGDISTPTPTPLLPTATPTPARPALSAVGATPVRAEVDWSQPRVYTVQPGDTLLTVAVETGVDLEEIFCAVAPDFQREQPLVVGNLLEIPPAGTRCHRTQPGDTLASIAELYGVTPRQILELPWNRLNGQPLETLAGTPEIYLRIPPPVSTENADASLLGWLLNQPMDAKPFAQVAVGGPNSAPVPAAVPANWPYGSGYFTWPVHGWLSQSYHAAHRALDIAAPEGTLVTAADRGVVIRAGWNDQGYGMFAVIDHNIDYLTLYAHLNELYVQEGQVVGQGDAVGRVGSSGNSTGPHLHFEIRDFGRLTDPLALLLR